MPEPNTQTQTYLSVSSVLFEKQTNDAVLLKSMNIQNICLDGGLVSLMTRMIPISRPTTKSTYRNPKAPTPLSNLHNVCV